MAEIFQIVNQPAFATDVTYIGIEPISTQFIVLDDKVTDGNTHTCTYDFRNGDARYKLTAVTKVTKKSATKDRGESYNFSVQLNGWVRHIEDATTPDTVLGEYPVYCVIAYDIHPKLLGASDLIGSLVNKTFSLFVNVPWTDTPGDAIQFEGNTSGLIAGFNFLRGDGINAVDPTP